MPREVCIGIGIGSELWRAGVVVASLDPFRGYATALSVALPDATRVLDCFHVVKLGFTCLDDVRRRVHPRHPRPSGTRR